MRISVLQTCLLLSMLLLAGCGGSIAAPLPPTAAASSPATTLAQPAAPFSVYIGSAGGTVVALDGASGVVRWHVQLAGAYDSTVVALEAGVVYVQAYDLGGPRTFFDALRASDGALLWHQTLASVSAVAAGDQGAVYLAFGGHSTATTPSAIEARRAQDGSEVWHAQLEGTGPAEVYISDGTLYLTTFSERLPGPGYYYALTFLYALNASTGAVRWQRQLPRTNAVAAVTTGQVYLLDTGTDVACEPRILHVLDSRSGTEQWQREGRFLDLLGVKQERAYVEDVPEGCVASSPFEQGTLSALHTTDGSGVWQSTIPFGAGAIASKGALYVPSEDGDLAAYSASTGVRLWRAQGAGGGLDLFDGVLYTSLEGRGLAALSSATGAVRWRYSTPDGVAILDVANGIFYGVASHINSQSGDQDSALVALRAGTGEPLWRVEIGMMEGTPLLG